MERLHSRGVNYFTSGALERKNGANNNGVNQGRLKTRSIRMLIRLIARPAKNSPSTMKAIQNRKAIFVMQANSKSATAKKKTPFSSNPAWCIPFASLPVVAVVWFIGALLFIIQGNGGVGFLNIDFVSSFTFCGLNVVHWHCMI